MSSGSTVLAVRPGGVVTHLAKEAIARKQYFAGVVKEKSGRSWQMPS